MFVGRGVPPNLPARLLVLAEHELEHGRAGAVGVEAGHVHAAGLVHRGVDRVLRSLDQPEDDEILLADEGGADVVQGEAIGLVGLRAVGSSLRGGDGRGGASGARPTRALLRGGSGPGC